LIAVEVVNIKIRRKTIFLFFFMSSAPIKKRNKNKTGLVRSMKNKTIGDRYETQD
jgi:hypothetical protein